MGFSDGPRRLLHFRVSPHPLVVHSLGVKEARVYGVGRRDPRARGPLPASPPAAAATASPRSSIYVNVSGPPVLLLLAGLRVEVAGIQPGHLVPGVQGGVQALEAADGPRRVHLQAHRA